MSIRHQSCDDSVSNRYWKTKLDEELPLLAHNELGKPFQFFQLRDTPSETLVVRVAVNVTPFLVPSNVVCFAVIRHEVFHGCCFYEEPSTGCGGAGEVALHIKA